MKFSGEIRIPDIDHPGIPATVVVEDTHIEIVLSGESLGRWSLFDVRARRLVSAAFEIDLAGEEITFIASDPIAFTYSGVDKMAEIWAQFKTMRGPQRMLAVRKSRSNTKPSRIDELRTAMLSNLEAQRPAARKSILPEPVEQPEPTRPPPNRPPESIVPVSEPPPSPSPEPTVVSQPEPEATPATEEEVASQPEPEKTPAPEEAVSRLPEPGPEPEPEPQEAVAPVAPIELGGVFLEEPVAAPSDGAEDLARERAALEADRARFEAERARFEELQREAASRDARRIEAFRIEMARLEAERTDSERLETERAAAFDQEMQRLKTEMRNLKTIQAQLAEDPGEDEERSRQIQGEVDRIEAERERIQREEGERQAEAQRLREETEAKKQALEREEASRWESQRREMERLQAEAEELSRLAAEQESTVAEIAEPPVAAEVPDTIEPEMVKEVLGDRDDDDEPDDGVVDLDEIKDSGDSEGAKVREKVGFMGSVRSAFTREKVQHEHVFTEAPGSFGLTRQICTECGFVSISVTD